MCIVEHAPGNSRRFPPSLPLVVAIHYTDRSLEGFIPKSAKDYEEYGRLVAAQWLLPHGKSQQYKSLLKQLLKVVLGGPHWMRALCLGGARWARVALGVGCRVGRPRPRPRLSPRPPQHNTSAPASRLPMQAALSPLTPQDVKDIETSVAGEWRWWWWCICACVHVRVRVVHLCACGGGGGATVCVCARARARACGAPVFVCATLAGQRSDQLKQE